MMFVLGENLEEVQLSDVGEIPPSAVFLTNAKDARRVLEIAGIVYENEILMEDAELCKLETQQECLAGTLCIPKLLDVLGSQYRILFFINKRHIVIVDDQDFSSRLIKRMRRKKTNPGRTKEKFIYNFFLEFISRDLSLLGRYERRLMEIEEDVLQGEIEDFQSEIMPIRKELLTLRGYYDQIADIGKELEENENNFFSKKHLKYFGIITDRAQRLMDKTMHLLEYAQQVRDAYQAEVDAKQNENMQFLTVLSTIFFPLTLITGWYGMNFENMPELDYGYPGVIILSVIVITVIIIFFKKKKIL